MYSPTQTTILTGSNLFAQTGISGTSKTERLDMSLNNLSFNRLINKKRNIEAAWSKPTHFTLPVGT